MVTTDDYRPQIFISFHTLRKHHQITVFIHVPVFVTTRKGEESDVAHIIFYNSIR